MKIKIDRNLNQIFIYSLPDFINLDDFDTIVFENHIEFKNEIFQGTVKNDELHSINGQPALTLIESQLHFYFNMGILHRNNDKPSIESKDSKYWYRNGLLHRDNDKPAWVDYYSRKWYKNGLLHRNFFEPAVIEFSNSEYWINGVKWDDWDIVEEQLKIKAINNF